MTTTTDVLRAALHLGRSGRPVFPCDPETKAPMVANGFKAASTSAEQIEKWFNKGTAMIGMPAGIKTKIVVIDLDGDEGLDAFVALERELGWALDDAVTVRTPRGLHAYFKHPGGEVRCSASVVAPRVDVRGDGGYVIVPPSVRADGRRYELQPGGRRLTPMPAWLLERVRAPSSSSMPHSDDEPALVPEGGRHHALVRFCGALRAMGLCEEALVGCGHAFLEHHCANPGSIDLEHAERSMRSVAKYPPRPNRGRP